MSRSDNPLVKFITKGKEKKALELLLGNVNVHAANRKGQSVLQLAANRDQLEIVQRLLEKKAAVDSRDQWEQTPLMRAAWNGGIAIMDLLLENGADIHARNADRKTPILYAAQNADRSTLKFLLERGANIDDSDGAGTTALMYATGREPESAGHVKSILKRCTNEQDRDWNGKNALDYAIEFGYGDVRKILEVAGLKPANREDLEKSKQEKQTDMIRRVSCVACGAPKQTPYKTPYIYCDYCASFIDWDYRMASESTIDEALQPEEVAKITERINDISASLEKARRKGKAEKYADLMKEYTSLSYQLYPRSYSPRFADKEYRARYLEYTRESSLETLRDESLARLLEEQTRRQGDVMWNEHYADSSSFWKLYEIAREFRRAWTTTLEAGGQLAGHPDQMNAELFYKMNMSIFAQAWLPRLSREDVTKVLADAGMEEEYHVAEEMELVARHCGGCGADLATVPDAKKVICEDCGILIDTESPEFACPSCSLPFSFPLEQAGIACPACQTMVSRVTADTQAYQ